MKLLFKELYQYRELLKTNVKKEIRGKYKASFLGVLWSFINPLLMVLVYALVFPYILRVSEENYLIFLIVAIIPWNFFTTTLTQGTVCVMGNANIIKKVYFPRVILPLSVVVSGLVNFLISCIIILLFVLGAGIGVTPLILFLPFIALIQSLLSLGIILILSAADVYVRDIEYMVNFLIMLAFYGTPILYDPTMFPESVRWLLYLNPMTHIIEAYRAIFYYQTMPDIQSLGIIGALSLILFVIGMVVFHKLSRRFGEEL